MAASNNHRLTVTVKPNSGHTLFRYTAKDIDGKVVRGTMEAADYDTLYTQLLAQGLYADGFVHHGVVVVGGHGGQHLIDGVLQGGVALLHGNTDVDILIADLEVLITTAKLKHFEIRISNPVSYTHLTLPTT